MSAAPAEASASPRGAPAAGRVAPVVALVMASGMCALVYQVVWTRHLRLVFGASTGASAAVLGIFMGGLGIGGLLLGRRADRAPRPLMLYAHLELAVAGLAALTPFLVEGVRAAYVATGGQSSLGLVGATALRLVLSALVLAPPTLLMGGTLPALARAVETRGDAGRRRLGRIYGANTFGAVLGAFLATFALLEVFGLRGSLWLAACVNALVGVFARSLARSWHAEPVAGADGRARSEGGDTQGREGPNAAQREARADAKMEAAPEASAKMASDGAGTGGLARFVYVAAAGVGFVFFAMELVWTRMLGPLLGGSVYGFGLVLTVALAGVGLGGWLYGRGAAGRVPTAAGFALTCGLEALLLSVPLVVGDDMVALALAMRVLNVLGFGGLVAGWALVASVLVLSAAVVAGYQFPLLVALLGHGRDGVGRQVGVAYLANTVGAILGSLVAGFGLMRLLGAVGLWRAMALVLVALAAVAWELERRRARRQRMSRPGLRPLLAGGLALACTLAPGPSAAWRHSPVGAGRVRLASFDAETFERFVRDTRRQILWEADGVESALAVSNDNGYAFLVMGKSDGNARLDAPTVVMAPLIGAMLHPSPRRGLVVGLGTGMSAGWLAEVETMERVDVVELEPEVTHVAELCEAVNFGALHHPKVNLFIGDGREFLATATEPYDVVMSEPSNPYRVGIASLFSRDLYEAAVARMSDDGVFVQWLQAYDVDADTVRTVLATMSEVFPQVEVWATHRADLALVGYVRPTPHDAARVAERAAREPYASALADTWGVSGAAGFYAGFVAGPELARHVAAQEDAPIDTDDAPRLEFGFSRFVGSKQMVRVVELRAVAEALGAADPEFAAGGSVPPGAIRDARDAWDMTMQVPTPAPPLPEPAAVRGHMLARRAARAARPGQVLESWGALDAPPPHVADLRMLAQAAVLTRHPRAGEVLEWLQARSPVDAAVGRAALAQGEGDLPAAAAHLVRAFEAAREDPWFDLPTMERALDLARRLAADDPATAAPLWEALGQPFAVSILNEGRIMTRVALLQGAGFAERCVSTLADLEPQTPWDAPILQLRVRCYQEAGQDELLARARSELERFERQRVRGVRESFLGEG